MKHNLLQSINQDIFMSFANKLNFFFQPKLCLQKPVLSAVESVTLVYEGRIDDITYFFNFHALCVK